MNWRTGMEKEHSHLGASPCKTLLGTPSLGSWPIRMGKQQYGSLKDVKHFKFIKWLYIIPDYFYFAINCMLPAFYKWRDLKIPAPQNPENRTRPAIFWWTILHQTLFWNSKWQLRIGLFLQICNYKHCKKTINNDKNCMHLQEVCINFRKDFQDFNFTHLLGSEIQRMK